MALEEIHGVDDFVEKLDKIESPSQLVAALDDPLLRTYVVLKQEKTAQRRLDNWLSLFLDSQMQAEAAGNDTSDDLQDVLNKLLKYTQYTKVSVCVPGKLIHLIILGVAAIFQWLHY